MKGGRFLGEWERECYHSRKEKCEDICRLENCSVELLPRSFSSVGSRRLETLRPRSHQLRDPRSLPFTWTQHPAMSSIRSIPIALWAARLTSYPAWTLTGFIRPTLFRNLFRPAGVRSLIATTPSFAWQRGIGLRMGTGAMLRTAAGTLPAAPN